MARQTKGKKLGGAPRRRGRWGQPPSTPRARPGEYRSGILFLLGLGFLILGGLAGFSWEMDRQLRGGLLRQRAVAERRPDWIPLERMPRVLPRMVAAVVDPTFQSRPPLGSQGDGTATLPGDLVRQVHLLREGVGGEARALVMAPLLESRLPKREILELYLNRVYFGKSEGVEVFGVHHAARDFFGKEPQQLTLGESATLAGLLLEPRIRAPERSPGAVGARRNEVLRRMRAAGVISEADYRAATAEPLGFQPGVEDAPMSRPPGWDEPVPVMRLPLRPDSAAQQNPQADSAAAPGV
jgi:membrane peptidoglycan carboxypeptidase